LHIPRRGKLDPTTKLENSSLFIPFQYTLRFNSLFQTIKTFGKANKHACKTVSPYQVLLIYLLPYTFFYRKDKHIIVLRYKHQ